MLFVKVDEEMHIRYDRRSTMRTSRTQFSSGIVAEYIYDTARPRTRIAIICDGMPSIPSKQRLMFFLAARGYAVFHIRYRGSWESSGSFLEYPLHEDIQLVMDEISTGFVDAWTGAHIQIATDNVTVIGASFAGPALFFVSADIRVKKIIAIAPVVDWLAPSEESLEKMFDFTQRGFNQAYRFTPDAKNKLASGNFYNPVTYTGEVIGEKICIIHAKDDKIVAYDPVMAYAQKINAYLISRARGGHLSSSYLMQWYVWWRVKRFLRT